MFFLTDALRVYSTLNDAALMRSRVKFSDIKPEGAQVLLTLWKPSARLRIHRRASSWWTRRRGEFNVGGGVYKFRESTQSRRPPTPHLQNQSDARHSRQQSRRL